MRHNSKYISLEIDAGEEQKQATKDQSPPRRGHIEPNSRQRARSEVSRERILRSQRHRPGQVRDAAPCLDGERVGNRRHRGIWRVEADVLSDQGQLRQSWRRWAGTSKA